jgi:hypothetical protein
MKSRWPTYKWWAALITATAAWVANFITAGTFTKAIAIALVGLVAQQAVAYLVPNSDTAAVSLSSRGAVVPEPAK